MYKPCVSQGEGTIDITKLSFCEKIIDQIYSKEYKENPSLKFLCSLHVLNNKSDYSLLSEDETEIINEYKNINIKTFFNYYCLELSLNEIKELSENINEIKKEDHYICDICGDVKKTNIDESGIIFSTKSFVCFVSKSGIKNGLGFCYCFIKYNILSLAKYDLACCFEIARMYRKKMLLENIL